MQQYPYSGLFQPLVSVLILTNLVFTTFINVIVRMQAVEINAWNFVWMWTFTPHTGPYSQNSDRPPPSYT